MLDDVPKQCFDARSARARLHIGTDEVPELDPVDGSRQHALILPNRRAKGPDVGGLCLRSDD